MYCVCHHAGPCAVFYVSSFSSCAFLYCFSRYKSFCSTPRLHLAIVDVAQSHHLPRIHLTPFTECLSIPLDLRVLSTRCCVHFLLQLGVQHQRKPKRSLGVCHDCPLQFRCRHYQGCRQQRHAAINLGTTFLAAAASVDDYGRRIDSPSCRSLSRRLWPTH